eukprot:COSAG06_NODE_5179_length_3656_cov_3.704245_3_plen_106_part_00
MILDASPALAVEVSWPEPDERDAEVIRVARRYPQLSGDTRSLLLMVPNVWQITADARLTESRIRECVVVCAWCLCVVVRRLRGGLWLVAFEWGWLLQAWVHHAAG